MVVILSVKFIHHLYFSYTYGLLLDVYRKNRMQWIDTQLTTMNED